MQNSQQAPRTKDATPADEWCPGETEETRSREKPDVAEAETIQACGGQIMTDVHHAHEPFEMKVEAIVKDSAEDNTNWAQGEGEVMELRGKRWVFRSVPMRLAVVTAGLEWLLRELFKQRKEAGQENALHFDHLLDQFLENHGVELDDWNERPSV